MPVHWQVYEPPVRNGGAFAGSVRVLPQLASPELGNARDILVLLPPGYAASDRRYPVLYMQDGQNLFDERTAFAGTWRVDEALDDIRREGLEAIVVAIPNMGSARADEYSPWPDARHGAGGQGDTYVRFVTETVRPRVDAAFRTITDRRGTGIAGSSLGGLISLYAFLKYPSIFGFCGALSPAFWFAERRAFEFVAESPLAPGRLYLDGGTSEGVPLLADVRRMCELLDAKGHQRGRDLLCVLEPGAAHNEQAWAARMSRALRFLLSGAPQSTRSARR